MDEYIRHHTALLWQYHCELQRRRQQYEQEQRELLVGVLREFANFLQAIHVDTRNTR
jgi:hypothetical protein